MVTKTELVKQELAKNPNPTPKEIKEIAERVAKQHESGKCSKALVHKCLRKMPKIEPTGLPEPVEPVVTVKEEAEREVPTIEEVTPEVPKKPEEKAKEIIAEGILEGKFTKEQLTALFQAINEWLPSKYRKSQDTCKLLGSVWESPINKRIEQIEDADLWFALFVTIVVYGNIPVQIVMERRKKPKPKKKEIE